MSRQVYVKDVVVKQEYLDPGHRYKITRMKTTDTIVISGPHLSKNIYIRQRKGESKEDLLKRAKKDLIGTLKYRHKKKVERAAKLKNSAIKAEKASNDIWKTLVEIDV